MARMLFCVPSYVAITNPQLVAIYWILTSIGVITLAVRFFVFGSYLGSLFIDDDVVHVNLWATLPDLGGKWDDIVQSPMCTSPNSFYYAWDDEFVYYPSGCSRVCTHAIDADCVAEGITRVTAEGGTEVFIATLRNVTRRDSTGAVSRQCTFVPEAAQVRIGITFSCEGEVTLKDSTQEVLDRCDWGTARAHTIIAILNSRAVGDDLNKVRQVNKTVFGSEAISFTVPEILWLSGVEGGLEDPTVEKVSRPATPGGTEAKPPALAVAGMLLHLVVHCYNFCPSELQGQLPDFNRFVHKEVCTINFVPFRSRWGELSQFDFTGEHGAYNKVYSTGLRIAAKGRGTYTYVDTDRILRYLINFAVLMKIPRMVVLCFCTAFLGHLSQIYSRVIFKHFDIEKEVAGMATRLLASNITFRELHRIGSNRSVTELDTPAPATAVSQDGPPKITSITCKDLLLQALEERTSELDDSEANAFVKFAYQGIIAASRDRQSSFRDLDVTKATKYASTMWNLRHMSSAAASPDHLGMDGFHVVHTSNEMIDFNSTCRLFDVDRHINCLERLFTPVSLRHALYKASFKHGDGPFPKQPGDEALPQAAEESICSSDDIQFLSAKVPALEINSADSPSQPLIEGPPKIQYDKLSMLASDGGQSPAVCADASNFSGRHPAQQIEIESCLKFYQQEVNSRFEKMSQLINDVAVTASSAKNTASSFSSLLSERLTVLETRICRSACEGSSEVASVALAPVQQAGASAKGKAPVAAKEAADADGLTLLALADVVENLRNEVRNLEMEVGKVLTEQMALSQQQVRQQPEPRESAENEVQHFSVKDASGSGSVEKGAGACAQRNDSEVERLRHALKSTLQRTTGSIAKSSIGFLPQPVPAADLDSNARISFACGNDPAAAVTVDCARAQPWLLPSTLRKVPKETLVQGESRLAPRHAQQEPALAPPREPTEVVIGAAGGAAAAETAWGAKQSQHLLVPPPRRETGGSRDSSAGSMRAAIIGHQQAHAAAGQAHSDRMGGDQGGGGGGELEVLASL